ncbi:7 transmembrane receptor (rhodopsin family) domain-containing protein [Ditylenchus destructor]|uniref:7 transmembrane receptor (Rhodopsin family) domain-containing protein n=1 Tax=Ditylenchus destructor TaxID=166010 RepID=A0AAD4QWR1_9BILA|nr:7 transmembrane receptor (rhodopsin family) domain-containing protein [Ditylenchus destructor]
MTTEIITIDITDNNTAIFLPTTTIPVVEESHYYISQGWRVTYSIVISSLTVVGLLGNILLVVGVLSNKTIRHMPLNATLVSMAIANSLYICVRLLYWIQMMVTGLDVLWVPGEYCWIVRYFPEAFVDVSSGAYLLLSIERSVVVGRCMRRYANVNNIFPANCILWLIAFVSDIPQLIVHYTRVKLSISKHNVYQCKFGPDWLRFIITHWVVMDVIFFVIPAILAGILNMHVCYISWNLKLEKTNGEPYETVGDFEIWKEHSSKNKRAFNRKSTVAKIVISFAFFVICFTPDFIVNLLWFFHMAPSKESIRIAKFTMFIWCAVYPLMHSLFSEVLRNRLKVLLVTFFNHIGGISNVKRRQAQSRT